jgi:hypothetical protein
MLEFFLCIAENEDEIEGKVTKWQDVLIHGDPGRT